MCALGSESRGILTDSHSFPSFGRIYFIYFLFRTIASATALLLRFLLRCLGISVILLNFIIGSLLTSRFSSFLPLFDLFFPMVLAGCGFILFYHLRSSYLSVFWPFFCVVFFTHKIFTCYTSVTAPRTWGLVAASWSFYFIFICWIFTHVSFFHWTLYLKGACSLVLSSPLSAYFGFCLLWWFFLRQFHQPLDFIYAYSLQITETYSNISLLYQRTAI